MIYLLGMTTISVIGTSLFNITIISLISLFLQITINQNVDFVLAVILIVSSSFGAAIASRIVERLDQENLKVLFGVLLIIIAALLTQFNIARPKFTYSLEIPLPGINDTVR